MRLPEHFENKEYAQEYSQHLTQDDEFGAEQKEHLWRVIRSIDFDNCQDTVFLQVRKLSYYHILCFLFI